LVLFFVSVCRSVSCDVAQQRRRKTQCRREAKSEAETTANSGVVWDSRGEAEDKRRANDRAKRTLSLSRR